MTDEEYQAQPDYFDPETHKYPHDYRITLELLKGICITDPGYQPESMLRKESSPLFTV